MKTFLLFCEAISALLFSITWLIISIYFIGHWTGRW